MSDMDELLDRLRGMNPDERATLEAQLLAKLGSQKWVPNVGPQTDAYFSQADELFYGGSAGGGKTDLIVGLALTAHQKSLIVRRFRDDAADVAERVMTILGSRDGFNGQDLKLRIPVGDDKVRRVIDFGGMKEESDKQRFKGDPHDLIGFDEGSDFLRSQYEFVITWNRSVDPDQNCRIVVASNPPTMSDGLWVIDYWGPWLHPNHPNPAKIGELRWYLKDTMGNDIEVDGAGPHPVGGEMIRARSRTFIRSKLSDNPDLAATDYDALLAGLPKELRDAYREGKFDIGLKDRPHQVIPSVWLRAAMARWTPVRPDCNMSVLSVDIAQGGEDQTVFSPRYGTWFDKVKKVPGSQTPDGPSVAGKVIEQRRHAAVVILDMGGGYGGSTMDHLKANDIKCIAYKGNSKSYKKAHGTKLKFYNKRSEAYWLFREALDPEQPDGSRIAMPNDPELFADLTSVAFEVTPSGIKVTRKEDLVKALGRSPDCGDAVVMNWSAGEVPLGGDEYWRKDQQSSKVGKKSGGLKVNTGNRGARRQR